MNDSEILVLNKNLQAYARNRLNTLLADERRALPLHVLPDLGEMGILALEVPKENGGLGLSTSNAMRVIEQLGGIDLSIAMAVGIQNYLAGLPLTKYGTQWLKDTIVPNLYSGRRIAAYALTEKAGGSDPRRIEAEARVNGDRWVVNGTKIWSGMALHSDVICTFAYAFDANGKNLGMSAFAIPTTLPGVKIGAEALTMGLRSIPQSMVILKEVNCPQDLVLGSIGRGWQIAGESMMYSRLVIAAACLGAMKRALQLVYRYRKSRVISSGAMCSNGHLNSVLGEMVSQVSIVGKLVQYTSEELDATRINVRTEELFLVSKIVASECAWSVVDIAIQILGGRGYMETNVLPRILRDLRVFRILEGPTEVLAAHLGGLALHSPAKLQTLSSALGRDELRTYREILLELRSCVYSEGPQFEAAVRPQLGLATAWAVIISILVRESDQETFLLQSMLTFASDRLNAFVAKASNTPTEGRDVDPILCRMADDLGDIEESQEGFDLSMDHTLSQLA